MINNKHKNEEFKYGYKLGLYEGNYKISLNFFKYIFAKNFEEQRKRIKWLSNYELELLFEYLEKCFCDLHLQKKDKLQNENKKKINKIKDEILKLLR